MEAVVEGLRRIDAVDVNFTSTNDGVEDKVNSSLMSATGACDGLPRKKIYVRLLLSIDRRETLDAAMETVRIPLLYDLLLAWLASNRTNEKVCSILVFQIARSLQLPMEI